MAGFEVEARDHPSLAKYPGGAVKYFHDEDGVVWRVPLERERDEAVPVPVEDLVQARGAVHQLKLLLEKGAGDEATVAMMGFVLQGTSSEEPPLTRPAVIAYLDGLRDRLTGSLPYW